MVRLDNFKDKKNLFILSSLLGKLSIFLACCFISLDFYFKKAFKIMPYYFSLQT